MSEIVIDVITSGPLFSGRVPGVVRDLGREAIWDVGMAANAETHQLLDESIRHPTPYYETQVTIERRVDQVWVHDRGVIYGPWLEGTSSRNRTTRFKGYSSFRRAAQATERRVPLLVARALARAVRRLS